MVWDSAFSGTGIDEAHQASKMPHRSPIGRPFLLCLRRFRE
jgi:hypothetical protein